MIANISSSDQSAVDLLLTDARIGLIFLDLAENTMIAEQRSRRIAEAHHVYQSILIFLPQLRPTADQKEILSRELSTLKDRLQEAGVSIDDDEI